MAAKQFDEDMAKVRAETSRLIDETSRIDNRNPYVPMVIGSVATLAIIFVVKMFA